MFNVNIIKEYRGKKQIQKNVRSLKSDNKSIHTNNIKTKQHKFTAEHKFGLLYNI